MLLSSPFIFHFTPPTSSFSSHTADVTDSIEELPLQFHSLPPSVEHITQTAAKTHTSSSSRIDVGDAPSTPASAPHSGAATPYLTPASTALTPSPKPHHYSSTATTAAPSSFLDSSSMERYLTPYQDYADDSSLLCDTSLATGTPRSEAASRFVSLGDLEEGPLEEEEGEDSAMLDDSKEETKTTPVVDDELTHPEMHLDMLKVRIAWFVVHGFVFLYITSLLTRMVDAMCWSSISIIFSFFLCPFPHAGPESSGRGSAWRRR